MTWNWSWRLARSGSTERTRQTATRAFGGRDHRAVPWQKVQLSRTFGGFESTARDFSPAHRPRDHPRRPVPLDDLVRPWRPPRLVEAFGERAEPPGQRGGGAWL